MPKFTLTGEHTDLYGNPDGTKVTYEFHADFLENILENFDMFLRGCGFNPTGHLDYIVDEFPEWTTEQWDTPTDGHDGMGSTLEDYPELNKSKYYFDTERNK